MKREINTKFYTYNQNNSGGSFEIDKKAGISEYVCIEAMNSDAANARAENIGLYFDGCYNNIDCDCCGDRWYRADESDGKEVPSLYGNSIEEHEIQCGQKSAFIHYIDDTFKEFLFKEKTTSN